MKNIVLIGFMGSGKTAVSAALAKKTGMKVADTDSLIVKKAGITIKRIFAKYGEGRFRKLETAAVKSAAKNKGAIISTGGGVVTRPVNVKLLKKNGVVVYLKNSFATSRKRLMGKKDRPLFNAADLAPARALFRKRQALYGAAADFTVRTDRLSVDRTAEKILKLIKGGKG